MTKSANLSVRSATINCKPLRHKSSQIPPPYARGGCPVPSPFFPTQNLPHFTSSQPSYTNHDSYWVIHDIPIARLPATLIIIRYLSIRLFRIDPPFPSNPPTASTPSRILANYCNYVVDTPGVHFSFLGPPNGSPIVSVHHPESLSYGLHTHSSRSSTFLVHIFALSFKDVINRFCRHGSSYRFRPLVPRSLCISFVGLLSPGSLDVFFCFIHVISQNRARTQDPCARKKITNTRMSFRCTHARSPRHEHGAREPTIRQRPRSQGRTRPPYGSPRRSFHPARSDLRFSFLILWISSLLPKSESWSSYSNVRTPRTES